jgi:hypothetical protein
MKQPSERPARKPYQSPKLLVYGNLAEMTKSAGAKSKPDGGTVFGKRRTGR